MRRARVLGLSPSPGTCYLCPVNLPWCLLKGQLESGDLGSSPGAPLIPWSLLSPCVKVGFWGRWREPRACRNPQAFGTECADRPQVHPAEATRKASIRPRVCGAAPTSQEPSQSNSAQRPSPVAEVPFGKGLPGSSGRPRPLGHTPFSCRMRVHGAHSAGPSRSFTVYNHPHRLPHRL